MTTELYRECPECGDEKLFEQPHLTDCPDAPDGDCPELACTECGAALILAAAPVTAASPRSVRAA